MSVITSAPGKVVLSGEYAVLDGAPAIAMAVNRRASVSVTEVDGELNRVTSPGFCDVEGQFRPTKNGVEWLQGEEEFRLVNSVWQAANVESASSRNIVIDTREFIDGATRRKTGIGSSAALTVALTAALSNRGDTAGIARRAHRDVQAGVGSGVDIACSVNGGLIEYRMENYSSRSLPWPPRLMFRLIWTGVAVYTADKLKHFHNNASGRKRSRILLSEAADAIAIAWRAGVAESILSQYKDYIDVLRIFSDDHDLGIFDAGHRELLAAAHSADLLYKPCGAGGGDVGIVLGIDEARLNEFVSEQAEKYQPLNAEIDARGVIIEESAL